MLIYDMDTDLLITAVEGTGDNLSKQDIEDGFTNYVMTSVYKQDGDNIELVDGGQMMSKVSIAELYGRWQDGESDNLVDRLLDYWSCSGDDYKLLDEGI